LNWKIKPKRSKKLHVIPKQKIKPTYFRDIFEFIALNKNAEYSHISNDYLMIEIKNSLKEGVFNF